MATTDSDAREANAPAMALPQRCWRAWWAELTPAEREQWRTQAQRPFLSAQQARVLRAEGLPLVAIGGGEYGREPGHEQVLFPLDLAELLDQDASAE